MRPCPRSRETPSQQLARVPLFQLSLGDRRRLGASTWLWANARRDRNRRSWRFGSPEESQDQDLLNVDPSKMLCASVRHTDSGIAQIEITGLSIGAVQSLSSVRLA